MPCDVDVPPLPADPAANLEGHLARDLLRVVALGGEALPPKLVEAWSGAFSLVSVYGVTECCVYQAHRVVKAVGDCGLLGPALVGTISLEAGEVVLRGPLVAGGVRDRPDFAFLRVEFPKVDYKPKEVSKKGPAAPANQPSIASFFKKPKPEEA